MFAQALFILFHFNISLMGQDKKFENIKKS